MEITGRVPERLRVPDTAFINHGADSLASEACPRISAGYVLTVVAGPESEVRRWAYSWPTKRAVKCLVLL